MLCSGLLWQWGRLYRLECEHQKVNSYDIAILILLSSLSLFTDYSAIWVLLPILAFSIYKKHWKMPSSLAILSGFLLNVPWLAYSLSQHFGSILASKKSSITGLISVNKNFYDSFHIEKSNFSSSTDFLSMLAHFFDFKFLIYEDKRFVYLMWIFVIFAFWGFYYLDRLIKSSGIFLAISVLIPYTSTISFLLF